MPFNISSRWVDVSSEGQRDENHFDETLEVSSEDESLILDVSLTRASLACPTSLLMASIEVEYSQVH